MLLIGIFFVCSAPKDVHLTHGNQGIQAQTNWFILFYFIGELYIEVVAFF